MTREIEIKVKLRWEGDNLMLGRLKAGELLPPQDERLTRRLSRHWDRWIASDLVGRTDSFNPTREAAMEAVEKAVIKAMGGEITQPGQMDAILKDQNGRDRFPRTKGGE
jgi:hypothetical protein